MRTAFLSALLILATAFPAAAQDKAKPNTLTPKEIADGWILLFDGETTIGWNVKTPGKSLKVVAGTLDLVDLREDVVLSSVPFGSCEFCAEYQCDTQKTLLGVKSCRPGAESYLGQRLPKQQRWTTARIRLEHRKLVIDVPETSPETRFAHDWTEPIVFRVNQGSATTTRLRNIRLKPLGLKSLFNGKDLTGWHVFPGRKSQFTVEDGCIVCKNGPGDLQTDGKYANFVLQLECKVNGKRLNSGIFFRCKANEYQNGYEAQIHNDFTADPPKTYTVEEYDRETHKLTGKKKVQSAAKDYGTGAIYRRVPARKSVAKDGEWFTMTIVAEGNHIATWVNGIQQVDWYDNRPPSDNPRTGCRLAAGHISIQGHDPTTNLSFRNIRIAELPSGGK